MEHAYHCPICFATWRKCGGIWDTKFVVCSLSLTVSSSCGTVNNVDTYTSAYAWEISAYVMAKISLAANGTANTVEQN